MLLPLAPHGRQQMFRITVDKNGLQGFTDDAQQALLKEYEGAVLQAFLDLRAETPIDEGTASEGWRVVLPTEVDAVARLFNDVPYIGILNEGHSTQAPAYFIEQVLVRNGFRLGSRR